MVGEEAYNFGENGGSGCDNDDAGDIVGVGTFEGAGDTLVEGAGDTLGEGLGDKAGDGARYIGGVMGGSGGNSNFSVGHWSVGASFTRRS